jgi:hypothetical protein
MFQGEITMRISARTLCWFAALSLLVSVAFAQGDRGTITGTVSDPAGAVVASAQIEAKNVDSGAVYSATTTAAGIYTLVQVPVGTYELSVTVPGFKKYVRQNIRVEVAQTIGIDVALEVGSAAESVTVSAEVSLLKTESADVSHNVTVRTLNELPMLGVGSSQAGSSGARNPNNVALLVPGTFYQANSNVKVNGAPTNSQSYNVEGLDSTNQLINFAPAQLQPSVDAIQEVSIQTSNYAAEFGTAGGGFFNVTMRSGANTIHGSAYDYAVNEILNAGTPFTDAGLTNSLKAGQLIRSRQRRHDYGFTFGGPIYIPKLYDGHDKSFFFFNWEQYRETQTINNIAQTVPIEAYRSGDFSPAVNIVRNTVLTTDASGRQILQNGIYDPQTARVVNGQTISDPFPNFTIPRVRMDPVALKVQDVIPRPNNGSGFVNNYLPAYPSKRITPIPSVKLDQMVGSKGKLSFYWSMTRTDSQYSPIYGNSDGLPDQITEARGTFIHSHVERLNYDHTITPTLLLHLSAGYQNNHFLDAAPILDFNAAQTWGLRGATVLRNVPNFTGFCPAAAPGAIQCNGVPAGGMKNMGPANSGQVSQFLEKPAANASLTWVNNSHTVKFGGGFGIIGIPVTQYQNTNGNYGFNARQTAPPYLSDTVFPAGSTGFAYASFLLGLVDNVQVAAPSSYRRGQIAYSAFAQDSWKVTRKLTLDYGLRYDFSTYPREQYGRAANFSPNIINTNAGGMRGGFIFEGTAPGRCSCDFAQNYPFGFGPRIGFAYQLRPTTVIRGGFGVVYSASNSVGAGTAATATRTNPGLGREVMTLQGGVPFTPTWPIFDPSLFPAPGTVLATLPGGIGMMDGNAGRPARQMQWSIGVQQELSRNLVVEASYVANRGVWWPLTGLGNQNFININALTPDRLRAAGLDINNQADVALLTQPLSSAGPVARGFKAPYAGFPLSQSLAQSLRPYPQFGAINVISAPVGRTWYDSLQAKATKRFSRGLTFTSVFTWQKSLQSGVEAANAAYGDVFNRDNTKWVSSFDQPFVFVFTGSYALPKFGKGALSYVAQDWQFGTLLQYSSGRPIPAPLATTNILTQLFQPAFANRVAGVNPFTVDLNCHCFDPSNTFVLNKDAWTNPPQGQFGNAAGFYTDYRYARRPSENVNFGRTFAFKERRYQLNVRVEFSNMFNRPVWNDPVVTGPLQPQTRAANGTTAGGFGYINRSISSIQFNQPRTGTFVARFQF